MAVLISSNIQKESARINANGDFIDPKTKQVVQKKEPEFTVPTQVEKPVVEAPPVVQEPRTLSIKELIVQAEANLAELKELRKQEIEKMKAELAELEAEDV